MKLPDRRTNQIGGSACARRGLLLVLTVCAQTGGIGQAAIIPLQGTFTISAGTSSPGALVAGDQFAFSLNYDDSVRDSGSNVSTTSGSFRGLFETDGTMTRLSGSGSWDPVGGTLKESGSSANTGNRASDEFISGHLYGPGFPAITWNGRNFEFFDFTVRFAGPATIVNDTGAGQTFRDQLGGVPAANAPWSSGRVNLTFVAAGTGVYDGASGTVTSLTPVPVPEPESAVLLLLGGGGLLAKQRRRPD